MIFKPTEKDRMIKYLDALIEKKRHIKIEYIPEGKTIKQNSYIHLVFAHTGEQTGDRMEDVKKTLKKMFPKYQEVTFNGETQLLEIDSLKHFTKEQMSVFIDEVTTFLRTEGIDVPDPEEKRALELYNWYRQRGVI